MAGRHLPAVPGWNVDPSRHGRERVVSVLLADGRFASGGLERLGGHVGAVGHTDADGRAGGGSIQVLGRPWRNRDRVVQPRVHRPWGSDRGPTGGVVPWFRTQRRGR